MIGIQTIRKDVWVFYVKLQQKAKKVRRKDFVMCTQGVSYFIQQSVRELWESYWNLAIVSLHRRPLVLLQILFTLLTLFCQVPCGSVQGVKFPRVLLSCTIT